jgi:transposase
MVVDLERLVPDDHKLRRVDRVIDLAFVRDLTQFLYARRLGRRSIDPETFFRMMIIRYMDGIRSDRELCRQVAVNIAYRWYLRLGLDEPVPDHSSLTRIRDRLGEATFKAIFERIVKACQTAGLVQGTRLLCDSTLVEADASLDSLKPISPPDTAGSRSGPKSVDVPRRLQCEGYRKQVLPAAKIDRKIRYSNDTHRSTTDPDARLVAGRGKSRKLLHKFQYSVDAGARVVTDCYVTGGNIQDVDLLVPRLEAQVRAFRFRLDEVVADCAYSAGKTYDLLHRRGVTTYIPCFEHGHKQTARRAAFHYDEANDVYVCPAGEELTPEFQVACGDTLYRADAAACDRCPLRADCISGRARSKTLRRGRNQAVVDSVKRRMDTDAFKRRRHERLWKIEGIIGEAKCRCGLVRASYRGREKVQIQAFLASSVQNFKRVMASSLIAGGRHGLVSNAAALPLVRFRRLFAGGPGARRLAAAHLRRR